MGLLVACPCVGVGACQGVVVPCADWIPGVQAVEAPYLGVHGGALTSGAFLRKIEIYNLSVMESISINSFFSIYIFYSLPL